MRWKNTSENTMLKPNSGVASLLELTEVEDEEEDEEEDEDEVGGSIWISTCP
jgi:hypothetical protein